MEDGNPSLYKDMINFDKYRMMVNRVRELSNLAERNFSYRVNPAVENYLVKPPAETDEKKLKEESLKCEPAA